MTLAKNSKSLYQPLAKSHKFWHPTEKVGIFENKEPTKKRSLKKPKLNYLNSCDKNQWGFIKAADLMLIPRNDI
jgi:hypothetical protein